MQCLGRDRKGSQSWEHLKIVRGGGMADSSKGVWCYGTSWKFDQTVNVSDAEKQSMPNEVP